MSTCLLIIKTIPLTFKGDIAFTAERLSDLRRTRGRAAELYSRYKPSTDAIVATLYFCRSFSYWYSACSFPEENIFEHLNIYQLGTKQYAATAVTNNSIVQEILAL